MRRSSDRGLKSTFTIESVNLVNGLPSWFIQVVMLAFGVFVAIRSGNAESAGNVVAIFLLTPALMSPIGSLSAYIVMAGSAWPRIETVSKMLESRASREESSGTVTVDSVPPTLVAENITFSYKPDSRRIFEDVSFELPPGKITGFVAKMGQGKTTFFKLALRFYDPQKGRVLLGGRPVADYAARQSLRSHRDDVAIPRVLSRHPSGQHADGQARRDRRGDPRHLRGDRSLESFAGRGERAIRWMPNSRPAGVSLAARENCWRSPAASFATPRFSFSMSRRSGWIIRRNSGSWG